MSGTRNIYLAALGSLLLHAMLLAIGPGGSTEWSLALALKDLSGDVPRPEGEAGTISVLLSSDEGEMSAAPADTSFDFDTNEERSASNAIAETPESLPEPTSPKDPSDSTDNATPSASGASQPVRHSIPLDAWSAQIMGRIERAWVRPLARLDGTFRCEVQITQTPQGEVRDVALTHCGGDPLWRESIARAVRYAAPLPAPPSGNAFRSVVTLRFQSEPLSPALLAQLLSVAEGGAPESPREVIDPSRDAPGEAGAANKSRAP